eukprot:CAMPEP_0117436366 /NCGR_PEP_ID=MMETSP0759-20121206/970_1 /TAXON_ID=63605 /ORGANISM="Percolomonas cosmopolitus, Strain WS" /LENGTH=633 /DNA_ID=CAMNT_0005227963 /DNA_START=529 /DNA_END=2430 /DNA_ORIENTATION=+
MKNEDYLQERNQGEIVEEVEAALGVLAGEDEEDASHGERDSEVQGGNIEDEGGGTAAVESQNAHNNDHEIDTDPTLAEASPHGHKSHHSSDNDQSSPTTTSIPPQSSSLPPNQDNDSPPRRRKRKFLGSGINAKSRIKDSGTTPPSPTTKKPHALSTNIPQSFRSQTQRFIFNSHLSLPFKKPETVARLNQICLRSLSGEHVGPGKEGACLFGDDVQGYTFSYVFKIKDFKARGHTRWMSFCLISMNLVDLAMNWSFLSRAMRNWIRDIKNTSNAVFTEEQKEMEREAEALRLMGKDPMAVGGGLGGMSNTDTHGTSFITAGRLSLGGNHTNRMSSRHEMLRRIGFRSTKRSREKLRCLSDLLRTQNFFELLHTNVCVILKAFLTRLVRLDDDRCFACGKSKIIQFDDEKYSFLNFYQQLKGIEDDYRRIIECIIYNILVGNQIVLRGENLECLREIVSACTDLAPEEAVMFPKDQNNKYIPTYQANFLVLHSGVSLVHGNTNLIDPDSAFLLDIDAHHDEFQMLQITSAVPTSALQHHQLDNFPRTHMTNHILKLLSSAKTNGSFLSRLHLLKQQCVTRAKVLVQIYMTVQNTAAIKENETTFLNMFSYSHNDIRVLRNFSTGQRHRKKTST